MALCSSSSTTASITTTTTLLLLLSLSAVSTTEPRTETRTETTRETLTERKRVLVLPMPFTSHTKYHTNVGRALSGLGHDVWLTMPDYLLAKGVLDTAGLTVVPYSTAGHVEEAIMEGFRDNYFRGQGDDWGRFLSVLKDHSHAVLTNQSLFHHIQTVVRPDFVIIDNIPNLKALAVIPYRLGVPFAFLGSAYEPISQRVAFAPAVTPVPLFAFTDRMTLCQRLQNSFIFLLTALHDFSVYPDAVARYAPDMPYLPLDRLAARAELWLVEMDHILDYPRTTLPNVKLIGGTATGPVKALAAPFSAFMDGAPEGVVIVSFGSYVLDLPPHISDKIFRVLMELPLKAVFRSNLTSPDPSKILTAPWLPQNDLLGHPHTKVFVSHSGKNGQYEALYHAVPVVATPIFGDQGHNAERMRSKGFGEKVDIRSVSAEDLRDTITQVAFTPAYKAAITKASRLFRIEFGVPMDRAAFWLDHVMTHGGGHMRSAGQDMPFYQFVGLDIVLCYVTAASLLLFLLGSCLLKCLKCVFFRRKPKSD